MLPKIICFTWLLLAFGTPAWANAVATHIPNAQMVGEARLTVMFWDVYDATLYAPDGAFSPEKPFALSIRYLMEIKGEQIAQRSIEEMRAQGINDHAQLTVWHDEMKSIFPDVTNGTTLTAVFIPDQHTQFFKNGLLIGTIPGDDFRRSFSNIWLGEKSSEPELRVKLMGQNGPDQNVSRPKNEPADDE